MTQSELLSIPVLTILIAGAVTIIGAVAAGLVTVIKAVSELRELRHDLATVSRDTETIKGHVNSEKTAADGRELALRREIELLREIAGSQKEAAALLAQAVASRTRVLTDAPMPVEVVNVPLAIKPSS